MRQWVTLWRAAQLVGVPRGTLQKRIRTGELRANEGMVSTDELLRLYPQLELERSGAFERASQIKESAFARRVRERALPSQEVLAQRLFAQGQELADVRRHLQRYHDLVVGLHERIEALARRADSPDARELAAYAEAGLADVLATETADVLAVMDDVLKIVSAHVSMRPSGREFVVDGRDTLLQAGLRAGLRLNYGCGDGTCGLCKARIVAGSTTSLRPHDYRLSEAERAQGYTLLCTDTAATGEVVVETLEAVVPPDIPMQQIVCRVRSITPLGEDTLHLRLQMPGTHRLRFLAGQSVTLGIAGASDDDRHAVHPIASCPCDERNLHFYIARDAADPVAEHLFAGAARPGDAVTLWGPHGDFVLGDAQEQLVFLACDMGVAPVRSLIEQAIAADAAEALSLYWLATRSDGHFIANQCRAWDEALDHFDYTLCEDVDAAAGARELVRAVQVDRFVGQCDFYVAGPATFVGGAVEALRAAGVPASRIASTVEGDTQEVRRAPAPGAARRLAEERT
ncbi:MAG: 2Fe-2S iron-sulfur cluster-binding protein [Rudaea sp.]